MKKKLLLVLATAAILFSIVLAGCGGGGIPQAQYDQIAAQLKDAQTQANTLQSEAANLKAQLGAANADLKTAQAKVTELQGQVSGLIARYELASATPAETAANIVRSYHETHVYSTYDMFVCSDMSSEVWNMLKAQGISSVIVVGNKDTAVNDILQSDHAWVLAEVAPGSYLALETTAGFAVPRSQNSLYYRGWTFKSPGDIKANNDLVKEYNLRVEIRNQINDEANEVAREHDQATNQQTADKLKAVFDKLVEIREAQEAEINKIKSRIDGLATRL